MSSEQPQGRESEASAELLARAFGRWLRPKSAVEEQRGDHETELTGVGTALVTPFTQVRRPRREGGPPARPPADRCRHSLPRAVRHDRREPDAHADAERVRIVEILVDEANGQVPVLAGAGGYNTREVIAPGRGDGARPAPSGLLSVTPYYNKPTQEGLYQHYRAIADSTPLPIVRLQRAGPHRRQHRDVDARAARRRFPNIIGVKEASGNITQMCDVCRARARRLHRPLAATMRSRCR